MSQASEEAHHADSAFQEMRVGLIYILRRVRCDGWPGPREGRLPPCCHQLGPPAIAARAAQAGPLARPTTRAALGPIHIPRALTPCCRVLTCLCLPVDTFHSGELIPWIMRKETRYLVIPDAVLTKVSLPFTSPPLDAATKRDHPLSLPFGITRHKARALDVGLFR